MSVGPATPATPTMRGQFPARTAKEMPVSRRERAVGFFIILAVALPPWLTGAWDEWSQWTTLVLALIAFAALFAPIFDYRAWPPSPPARAAWWRLRRFPIFWLGLVALVYGLVAALNPWKLFVIGHFEYGLHNLSHLAWLPHGVDAPFSPMNAWRALLVLAPAWLVACAAWVGLDGARPLRWLLAAIALNGALLAAVGIAQQLAGSTLLLWSYDSRAEYPDSESFGSFVHSAHAAAWLVLAFGAAVALVDRRMQGCEKQQIERALTKSDLVIWLWLLGLTILLVALEEFVQPDFWILACGAVMGLWAWIWVARLWRAGRRQPAIGLAVLAALFSLSTLVVAGAGVWYWRQGVVISQGVEINPANPSLPVRHAVARVSADMIEESPLFGWGPGAYRYASRYYLLFDSLFTDPAVPGALRYRPDYAYNDWVQITVEWGLAGLGLLAGGIGWWLAQIWQMRRTLPSEVWCVFGAILCVFAGAMCDFPLQNPAVLICLGVLMTVVIKSGHPSPVKQSTGKIFHGT